MAKRGTAVNACLPLFFCMAILGAVVFTAFGGCRQSRSWSRISGQPLKLELPADFERPISFTSGRDGEKDLFYETSDGNYKVKTYTDSGYMEAEISFVAASK